MQVVSPLEPIVAAYEAIQDSTSTEEVALRNCKTAVIEIQTLEQTAFPRAAAGAHQGLSYKLEIYSSRTSWGFNYLYSYSYKTIILV